MSERATKRSSKAPDVGADHAERLAFGWDVIQAANKNTARFVAEMKQAGELAR